MTDVRQRTEGAGQEPKRTHPAIEHSHDYRREAEVRDRSKESHVHDQAVSAALPA